MLKRSSLVKLLYSIFLALGFHLDICQATIFSNSLQNCQDHCLNRNLAIPLPHSHLGWPNISQTNCDFDCLLDACRLGCQDMDSLNSSCDLRCDSIGVGSGACYQGCRAISDIFLHEIQGLIDLASVETFSDHIQGIGLNWTFPEGKSTVLQEISTTNIKWVAQSRAALGGHGWQWTKMEAKAFKENVLFSTVFLPTQTFTDVELRLAAIWRDFVVVSRIFHHAILIEQLPSVFGVHRPPPSEGSYLQLSASSFVVCWNIRDITAAAHNSNIKFLIRLYSTGPDGNTGELIAANKTSSNCHIFRNITINGSNQQLRLTIGEIEQEGQTSELVDSDAEEQESKSGNEDGELQLSIALEAIHESEETTNGLVFTDGSTLYLMRNLNDYVMLMEPTKIPFALNESQTITALAAPNPSQLFLGLSDGSIFMLDMQERLRASQDNDTTVEGSGTSTRVRFSDGMAITQIVVDHLQEYFYAIREKTGILRCQMRSCENNSTTLTMTNSPNFVQKMAVDPWNGFLYYTTSAGDIYSTPLFPLDAPQNYFLSITRKIADLPAANTVEVDLREQKMLAITKTGQLMSRDLVDGTIRDEREGWTPNDQYRAVVRTQYHRNRLYWISTNCDDAHPWESCLRSEEFNPEDKSVHLNKYLFSGAIKEFVLLRQYFTPPLMIPPSRVGLLLSDTEALISWKAPVSMPFQASGSAWRALSYEYILSHSHASSGEQDNSTMSTKEQMSSLIAQNSIQQSNIIVQLNGDNAADAFYMASVKACTGQICSAPIKAINQPIRLEAARKTVSLLVKRPISSESAVDGTVPPTGQLTAMDLLGKEILADKMLLYPQIPADPSITLAFDNASNVLYTSSRKDATVSQGIDAVNIVRFLDTAFIHQMALCHSKAVLLAATAYSVVAYRTTSHFDKIIYNCVSGSEECGEVLGIATEGTDNDTDGSTRIFLLIQLSSGIVQLLSTTEEFDQPLQMIATSKGFPFKIRQMAFADERLLLLTEDGYFGTLDLSLQNLNLNSAIRDVQQLLVANYILQDRHIHFDGPIQFDDKLGQLRWSVSNSAAQSLSESEVPFLFNVALFRDGFANSGSGEKTLAMSQDNALILPARLVQAWHSRQRFDVQVEAISPWTRVWENQTGLNTATKPPSSPENMRIYATQQKTIDGTRAIIDLFWDEPKEWNGDKLGYQLNCTISQAGNVPIQYTNAVLKGNQRSFSFPIRSGRISCIVFAMNDQHLMGPPSATVEIDGSEFKPLIRLYAIDSMENLISIQNWTIEAPKNSKARFLAKNRRQIQSQKQSAHYQTITFVGNEFYAVRKELDLSSNPQLFLVKLDMNQLDQLLYKATLVGDFTQIDAIAADWVANRLLLVGNHELMQIQMDQLQQDSTTITPKRIIQLSIGSQDAKQLVFDPFNNTAYLLTKNGSLFALDLNKKTETNLELTTGCLRQKTITSIVAEFIWNRAASPRLFALTWNGLIELKLGADSCPDINVNWDLFGERGLKAISLFTVADKVFVFATPNELLVYERSSGTVSQLPIPSPPLHQLLATSQSAQPFPDRDCFQLPSSNSITFTVRNEGRTGAVVEISEPKRESLEKQPPIECQNISQPQTEYEMRFRKRGTDKERIHHSYSNKTVIEQGVLDKNTDYDVSVGWLNRYWLSQGQSEPKLLHTGYGFPSAPKDPNALSLSPDTVLLGWSLPDLLNAPVGEIRYRISQQSPALISPVPVAVRPQEDGPAGHFSNLLADVISCEQNPCQAKVPNLRPSTDYHFWVTALHISRIASTAVDDLEATSVETQAHTREIPGTLRLENVTSTLMNLRWNTLPGAESGFPPIQQIQVSIQYRQSGVDALWTEIHNSTFVLETNSSSTQGSLCVDSLRPATMYDYRYVAEYLIASKDDVHKKELLMSEYYFQQAQQARTKAGTPTAPTQVLLSNEPMGGGWTLKWTAPESDGGEPILNYAVEYRPDSQSEWEIAERGLPADRLNWRVAWAKSHARHGKEPSDAELAQGQFRVRAGNVEGFGEFGYTKVPDNGENSEQSGSSGIIWYFLLAFLLALCLLCSGAYGTFRWKMAKRRKIRAKLHKPICLQSISQQIQQSHQSELQFSPEVQNELKILPKISSERVKKTNHLGMGSFGLVCEGFMQLDREVSVRVAIKYLKDNSHENHIKFLKEAILMNNFDHPNIVKLLGVNMDECEHFLVLELMDGGDLLNFLRDCRPKKGHPSRLCLRDLIAMAVDVGRGCVYLETYKHVHRDIAARNCLISSRTSPQRVTKIADFGLARSLFVDDYYRDMLPLRWLSPEVITHGLFTSKSDVWAFGVLLWEIITLGEQPYSNKQNPEVLNLLSNGIYLERPVECPNELYEQMKACWIMDTEKRPRFIDIQPRMESIRGLPHFQSREPFPSGFWNGFDNSQDSSISTRDSSTTTNGGDSSSGFHFEKSENSSTKQHPRLTSKQQRHHSLAGQHSAAFSTATTSTALDPSADYELPIRPRVQSLQRHTGFGQSGPYFQNKAFISDSSGGTLEEPWRNQSYHQIPSTSNDRSMRQGQHHQGSEDSPSGQKKFGNSSSRVSRV